MTDWQENQEFTLHIPEGIAGKGGLTTEKEQSINFRSIAPFSVSFPSYEKHYAPNVFDTISVSFSAPISPEDFWDYLSIDLVQGEDEAQYRKEKKENLSEWEKINTSRYIGITPPASHWYPSKEQTITIKKGLKDKYGRILKENQTFTFTPEFPHMVRGIYFPSETKNYQTGTVPRYSLWYSGGIYNVSLKVQRFIPFGNTFKKDVFTKTLEWEKSPEKRTVVEFDFAKEFPKIVNKNNELKQGWYIVTLLYVPEKTIQSSFHSLNSEFGVGDFPVEMKHTANNKLIITSDSEAPFDALVFSKSYAQNRTLENIGFFENNQKTLAFNSKPYPEKIVFVSQNGKIGIGSTGFQKGMSVYDAPVAFSPYQYEQAQTGVVFTDRPLFKPKDTVFFKSIFRDRKFFEKAFPLETVNPEKIVRYGIEIFDSQYERVYSEEFESKGGSLDGKWEIPQDAKLGQYRINIRLIEQENYSNISRFETTFYVTEYRKPDFLIDADFETSKAVWKEDTSAHISAEYAFGGGLAGKNVEYTLSLFGHKKQYWYWDLGMRQDKRILSGKTTLDEKGNLEIPLKLDVKSDPEIEWNLLNLEVTVESSPGEKSTKTISIPFFQSNEKIELQRDKYFYQQSDTQIQTKGKITDLDDKVLKNKTLKAELLQNKWVRNDRKGGNGEFVGEWKEVETEIESQDIKSDEKGLFEVTFDRPENAGQYIIRITSEDKKSRIAKAENRFWVWTDRQEAFNLRQNDVNRILPLFNEKDTYQIGDKATVLFPHNKWKIDKVHATIERGTVLETLEANLENNTVSFDIKPWMAPNVFVSILIEGTDEKSIPQIRWGAIKVPVTDPSHTLSIELNPEKTVYRPSEKAKIEIITTVNGKPASGEVAIAVVDQTLLALKARPELELWKTFLTELPLGVQTYHSLANFMSEIELQEVYDQVKKIKAAAESPFGGGGGMAKGEEFKPRGDFRDTAAFLASVKTDENGRATVEIPLADNLTKWNIWAVGHTNNNAFGEAESEVQTTLPVLISPIMPNFFRAGDETQAGLLIRRNIEGTENVKVSLKLPEEIVSEDKDMEKTVLVKEERRLFFPLSVPYDKAEFSTEEKEISLRFDIEGMDSGFKDSVVLKRKIVPPIMNISVAEFLKIDAPTDLTFETDAQSLKSKFIVKIFGTLIDRLQKFVDRAEETNYLCAEQRFSFWTSRIIQNELLSSVEKETETINTEKLKEDRDFILNLQDQGFKFWANSSEPSEWLTANILEFSPVWKDFGAEFPSENLNQAQTWLKKQILKECTKTWCISEATRQYAAFILAQNNNLAKNNLEFLSDYTSSIEAQTWFIRTLDLFQSQNKALSPTVLAKKEAITETLQQLMKARDRYVFWEESESYRSFYSQNERLTALVFEWLSDNDLLTSYHAKIARYLTESETQHLSGNSALRILKALKTYSKTISEDNFPLDFLVKNLASEDRKGTLETPLETEEIEAVIPAETKKTITFETKNEKQFYADAELQEIFASEDLEPIQQGFWVEREIYEIEDTEYKYPVTELEVGKSYLVRIKVISNTSHRHVIIEDTIPAGTESINFDLENTSQRLQNLTETEKKEGFWDYCYGWCTPKTEHKEFYFDKTRFFVSRMEAGTHEFKYLIQARIKGEYEVLPVKVSEMYYPEVFAAGEGLRVKIED